MQRLPPRTGIVRAALVFTGAVHGGHDNPTHAPRQVWAPTAEQEAAEEEKVVRALQMLDGEAKQELAELHKAVQEASSRDCTVRATQRASFLIATERARAGRE